MCSVTLRSALWRPDDNKGPRVIAATDPRPSRPGPVHLRVREFIHKCPRASCDGAKALAPEVSPLFGANVPIALFPKGATGCDPFARKRREDRTASERNIDAYVRFFNETVKNTTPVNAQNIVFSPVVDAAG